MELDWSERILFGGMKEWTLLSHQTLTGQIAFPRSPSNFPATLHATCSYESNLREEETQAQRWSDLPKAAQLKQGRERSRTACPREDGWHVGRTNESSLSLSSPLSPLLTNVPSFPFCRWTGQFHSLVRKLGERQGAGPYLAPLCSFVWNKRKRLELMTLDRILWMLG